MFEVEITYLTMMGNLRCNFSTSQTLETREEADELRDLLKTMPELANATVRVKRAKRPPTVDDAMQAFRKHLAEYPVVKDSAA